MKDGIIGIMAGWLGLAAASAGLAQSPPVPAPAVPPPTTTAPAATASPAPEASAPAPPAAADAGAKPEAPGATITLQGDKQETLRDGKLYDGVDAAAKTDVKAEKGTLTATITAIAGAHAYLGFHSASVHEVTLVQEFDVASTDPKGGQVLLTLDGSLKGYLRSRHKGMACVRLASATVAPAAGGYAPLAVSIAPLSVSGPDGQYAYAQESKAPEQTLPAGRYILTANFKIDSSADGLLNGHGVANFSGDDLPTGYAQENDPFKDAEKKDYGFSLTLTAAPAPGAANAQAAHAAGAPDVKKVNFVAPAPRGSR